MLCCVDAYSFFSVKIMTFQHFTNFSSPFTKFFYSPFYIKFPYFGQNNEMKFGLRKLDAHLRREQNSIFSRLLTSSRRQYLKQNETKFDQRRRILFGIRCAGYIVIYNFVTSILTPAPCFRLLK